MQRLPTYLSIALLSAAVTGCDLVGDILEFGFWLVFIFIALVVLLGWWLARKLRGPRRGPPPPPAA